MNYLLKFCAAVSVALVLCLNWQQPESKAVNSQNFDLLELTQLTAMATVECMSGGCGSTSCSHSGTIGPISYDCSVECSEGYYACCALACTCESNTDCP